jgi:hypothetical protein
MHQSDDLVVTLDYSDAHGVTTQRVVSPIRFLGNDRFLAFCLSREEPRQFYLDRLPGSLPERAAGPGRGLPDVGGDGGLSPVFPPTWPTSPPVTAGRPLLATGPNGRTEPGRRKGRRGEDDCRAAGCAPVPAHADLFPPCRDPSLGGVLALWPP